MSVSQSCPTACDPMDYSPPGSSVHGIFPGKKTGLASHSLLPGIFWTQRSNLGVLHCTRILYHLSHQGSPLLSYKAYNQVFKSDDNNYYSAFPFKDGVSFLVSSLVIRAQTLKPNCLSLKSNPSQTKSES